MGKFSALKMKENSWLILSLECYIGGPLMKGPGRDLLARCGGLPLIRGGLCIKGLNPRPPMLGFLMKPRPRSPRLIMYPRPEGTKTLFLTAYLLLLAFNIFVY